MTYQPQYPPAPPKPRPGGFAVTALVLGIVGVVLSFMPVLNNLTAAGAAVGFVLGMIGLWRSRVVMSGIGVFLCGVAVILTVVAQQQLRDDLDQIGDDLDSALSSIPTEPPAAAVPVANKVTTTACREFADDPAVDLVRDSIAAGATSAASADVARAFDVVFDLEVTAVTPGLDPAVSAAMDLASQQSEVQRTVWADSGELDPTPFGRMLAGVDTACETAGVDMA